MTLDVEQRFLQQLLDGLDDHLFDQPWSSQTSSPQRKPRLTAPSPSPSPSASRRQRTAPTLLHLPPPPSPPPPSRPPTTQPDVPAPHRSHVDIEDCVLTGRHHTHRAQPHPSLFAKPRHRPLRSDTSSRAAHHPPSTTALSHRLHLPIRGWRLDDMSQTALRYRRLARQRHRAYTRCTVVGIAERTYLPHGPSTSRIRTERILVLHLDSNSSFRPPGRASGKLHRDEEEGPEVRMALLRDEWMSTHVQPGDVVHLIGRWERERMHVPDPATWSARIRDDGGRERKRDGSERAAAPSIDVEIEDEQGGSGPPPSASEAKAAGAAFDEDDDDDDLWAELGSLPSLSQPTASQTEPGPLVETMILSSQPGVRLAADEDEENPDDDGLPAWDSRDNLLVVHPDVLVPATKVSDVASCVRKPVIQDRLRGGSELSVPLVMGNMLHEVLQACLTGRGATVQSDDEKAFLVKVERVRRQEAEAEAKAKEEDQDDEVQRRPSFAANEAAASVRDWPETWTGIGDFSRPFVIAQISAQVQVHLDSLFAIGLDTDQACAKLEAAAAPFGRFAAVYLANPSDDGGAKGGNGDAAGFHDEAVVTDARSEVPVKAMVTRILDVEEEVWSPMYGLKGKVDVSIEAVLLEAEGGGAGGQAQQPPRRSATDPHLATSSPFRTRSSASTSHAGPRYPPAPSRLSVSVMPLELKTGRSTAVGIEHRAQTTLYTLMLSDQYGCNVRDGLLYYSKSGQLHRIRKSRNEVRALVMGRNELARYLLRSDDQAADGNNDGDRGTSSEEAALARRLPPTIDNAHKCRRCYAVDGCMLFRRAIENVVDPAVVPEQAEGGSGSGNEDATAKIPTSMPSPIAELYAQKTAHLTQRHADFFQKWNELLSMEEQDAVRFRRELWTMKAEEREQVGRCLANMRLVQQTHGGDEGGVGVGVDEVEERATRTMRRFTYRFERHGLAEGAGGEASLLNGHISCNDPVTISIEPGLLSVAQGFVMSLTPSYVEVGADHDLSPALQRSIEENGAALPDGAATTAVKFRIDRDELSAGTGKVRSHLASLFWAGEAGDARRRELIVDGRAPRFLADDDEVTQVPLPPNLNEDQREAVTKVLRAQDYALILGMPGTGKTTTIAELIKLLAKRGKTVLLTSYTHSAVDTILRKLVGTPQLEMLRLGNGDKIHPDTRHLTMPQATTVEELERLVMAPNVVATTCLSLSHVVLARRKFDYCIVDEASQITLPTCLGPLRWADKFVLVGDHFQLPPLVRDRRAREGGLEESLFKLLSERHEEAVVRLKRQYRMNEDIMTLSNRVVYGGRLRCGNEEVRTQTLVVPGRAEMLARLPRGQELEWVNRLVDGPGVVFIDTDALPSRESHHGSLLQNTGEVRLVSLAARLLVAAGVSPSSIGVITPYRHQLKLLSSTLSSISNDKSKQGGQIETLTADKAQGRDKDVILLSMVRSNEERTVGQLVKDTRRLNVAFTRAKRKVVVVGSWQTLRAAEEVGRFLEVVEEKRWRVKVDGWREVEEVERAVERLGEEGEGGREGEAVHNHQEDRKSATPIEVGAPSSAAASAPQTQDETEEEVQVVGVRTAPAPPSTSPASRPASQGKQSKLTAFFIPSSGCAGVKNPNPPSPRKAGRSAKRRKVLDDVADR
ncbi:DNA replication endonuclease-helicase Dna2 [Thecaphora frezii]